MEYALSVPLPDYLCATGLRYRRQEKGRWRLFTPRHKPDHSLQGYLTFALKYEGVDLAVLKALFESVEPRKIAGLVKSKPTGAYSRRIWFLYEWLCQTRLDLTRGNFIPLIEEYDYGVCGPDGQRRPRFSSVSWINQAHLPKIRGAALIPKCATDCGYSTQKGFLASHRACIGVTPMSFSIRSSSCASCRRCFAR